MGIFIIAEPCISVKDASCVAVCPVDCIETSADVDQYFIDPSVCIECGQCELVCPVNAVFEEADVPAPWLDYIDLNARFFATPSTPKSPSIDGLADSLLSRLLGQVGDGVGLSGLSICIVDRSGVVAASFSAPAASSGSAAAAAARECLEASKDVGDGKLLLSSVDSSVVGAVGIVDPDDESTSVRLRRAAPRIWRTLNHSSKG